MKDLMHSRYSSLMLFIFLALIFIMPQKAAGHNFIGKVGCFECHEKLPMGDAALHLKANIEKVCMKCHARDLSRKLTHPAIGAIPKTLVPLDMPLDREGKVTCVTCHDVHMPAINKLTGKKTYYLRRMIRGKKFCYACHAKLPSKF